MKVLAINTYAGSLLIGAQLAGAEIIGSLEDEAAFGLEIQKLNYKDIVPVIEARASKFWNQIFPDLSDVVVVAHPPCSAFSVQNNSASKKGLGSEAFKCTENVLEFAMRGKAKAICIESVVPALEGAREVHDSYAKKFGYSLFRILQNAVTFGVPQDRERFWAIFVREDVALAEFYVNVQPDVKHVRDFLSPIGEVPEQIHLEYMAQRRKWFEQGIAEDRIMEVCSGKNGPGQLNGKIAGSKLYDQYALYKFRSRNIRLLDIDGWTNTLLSDSFWIVPNGNDGRVCTIQEFCSFMGFPRDYKWTERMRRKAEFRAFLSKGVCPPVAAWVLENVRINLERSFGVITHYVKDGSVLNLCHLTAPTSPDAITRAAKVA